MKIAITSSGEGLQAPVDERFGRAKNFVIVEVNGDEKNVQTVPNTQIGRPPRAQVFKPPKPCIATVLKFC